jgi:CHAT domain-containing protein
VQEALSSPEVLAGPRASKAAMLKVRHPLVLHVATHAAFESPQVVPPGTEILFSAVNNPMLRSALVFAGADKPAVRQGAIATALELSSLDLDGTELVVLSACETGLGGETAGEGIFGLRRAFAAAGARRLVFSLWKVDDDATAFLMGAFYDT